MARRRVENKKIVDPVDGFLQKTEEEVAEEEDKVLDASNISLSDLHSIPESVASGSHPFEGYPQPKIKRSLLGLEGDPELISKTWIVVLDPNLYVFQDHSGKGQTIELRDKQGKKTGKTKIVNLKTPHSRVARNVEEGRQEDYVFDRVLELEGGHVANFAIVQSHSARAQICFKIVKGKTRPDKRYRLLDDGQKARLREAFNRVHYQQMKADRMARSFDEGTGEFATGSDE